MASNPEGIYLWQQKYALDILTDAGQSGAKPLSFPMEKNHRLGKCDMLFYLILTPIAVWMVFLSI